MAATQYQIFVRYLNERVGKPLTNKTQSEWISAEDFVEIKKFYEQNLKEYEEIKEKIITGSIKFTDLNQAQLTIYENCTKYENIKEKLDSKDKTIVQEYCDIRSYDSLYNDTNNSKKKAAKKLDYEKYQIVIDESSLSNPKYDMIFMYDGIGHVAFPGYDGDPSKIDKNPPPNDDDKTTPEIYYDRMKRIKLDPWFSYSIYASLNAAMMKAEELVNILGKDSVKIGKVVPLDQYIEIV